MAASCRTGACKCEAATNQLQTTACWDIFTYVYIYIYRVVIERIQHYQFELLSNAFKTCSETEHILALSLAGTGTFRSMATSVGKDATSHLAEVSVGSAPGTQVGGHVVTEDGLYLRGLYATRAMLAI